MLRREISDACQDILQMLAESLAIWAKEERGGDLRSPPLKNTKPKVGISPPDPGCHRSA